MTLTFFAILVLAGTAGAILGLILVRFLRREFGRSNRRRYIDSRSYRARRPGRRLIIRVVAARPDTCPASRRRSTSTRSLFRHLADKSLVERNKTRCRGSKARGRGLTSLRFDLRRRSCACVALTR